MSHAASETEADRLCELIEEHADQLSTATLGKTFQLGSVEFRLHGADRNTIYRVSDRSRWFLKLPRAADRGSLMRERLGATIVGEILGSRSDYGGAAIIRASEAPAYVLSSEIAGRPMNRVLITTAWRPWPDAAARLTTMFETLGRLLATLHVSARLPADAPEATKRPFSALAKRLERVAGSDATIAAIAAWYSRHGGADGGTAFVHGNMRLDNVMEAEGRVGFLDFEHCGSGSFYQDLARPVTHLLQVSAISPFPRERVIRALGAYLKEYRRIHPFDADQLNVYVAARMGRYYLETQGGVLPSRIGGFPVLRSRLARLTTTVLESGVAGAAPELTR